MSEDSQAHDPLVGEAIGAYRVQSLLGVGAMSHVYRAAAPDGVAVALKLVKPELARDALFRRRFAREAAIARTVRDPHVVAVLATGEHDGRLWMAQQLIDGPTLARRLADGPLAPEVAIPMCADVAAGLEALWAAGLVHRDVKPANILFDALGSAYLTDFGLAKDTEGSVLTLPGQALGSLDYMSPEQVRGDAVSAASDVYALGCVMYETLCGRSPFAHVRGARVMWAHLREPPPDPRAVRPELPPALAAALLTALAKDPVDRPATAGTYARLLAAAVA